MNESSSNKRALLLVAAIGLSTLATQTAAQSGYVTDEERDGASNTVVRSGTGLCWHTSEWTPQSRHPQCDPSLKPEAAAPMAVPVTRPVAAAPVEPASTVRSDVPAERTVPVGEAYVTPPVVEKIILSADMLFDNDKSVIKPAGKAALDELVGKLAGNLRVILPVGYTSSTGTDAYNMALSIRRADAVKAYLVSRGIDAERVHASGRGESDPVATNFTAAGRAENRRVEIEVMPSLQQAKW